jgi:hypothetical protein
VTNSAPRVEHVGDRIVYFHAGDGIVYRVHDAYFSGGRHHRVPHQSARATSRAFIPERGARRLYRFRDGEARALTAELLELQLRNAEYLPTEAPDPAVRDPR